MRLGPSLNSKAGGEEAFAVFGAEHEESCAHEPDWLGDFSPDEACTLNLLAMSVSEHLRT